jgi:hypothetical protein
MNYIDEAIQIKDFLERIANATERTAELLETLMLDDELIESNTLKYAKLANQNRLTK